MRTVSYTHLDVYKRQFCVCVYPLYEGRHGIYTTCRGMYWDLSGQTHKLREWQNDNPEELHVVRSQISAKIHNPISRLGHVENNLDDIIES